MLHKLLLNQNVFVAIINIYSNWNTLKLKCTWILPGADWLGRQILPAKYY